MRPHPRRLFIRRHNRHWSVMPAGITICAVLDVLQNHRADEERSLLDELHLRGNLDDVILKLARDARAIARIESIIRCRHTDGRLSEPNSAGCLLYTSPSPRDRQK